MIRAIDPTCWDPRVRIVMAVMLSLLTASVADIAPLLTLLAITIAAFACFRPLSWTRLAKRLLAVGIFVALIWATLPWSWNDARVEVDARGLSTALVLTVRTAVVAIGMSIMLARMDAWTFAHALAGLGLPAKLVQLLLLTARYIELFTQTRHTVERAMRARGFVARPDRRTFAALGQLLARLVSIALDRARRVEWAMRARRYDGGFRKVTSPRVDKAEVVLASVLFGSVVVAVVASS